LLDDEHRTISEEIIIESYNWKECKMDSDNELTLTFTLKKNHHLLNPIHPPHNLPTIQRRKPLQRIPIINPLMQAFSPSTRYRSRTTIVAIHNDLQLVSSSSEILAHEERAVLVLVVLWDVFVHYYEDVGGGGGGIMGGVGVEVEVGVGVGGGYVFGVVFGGSLGCAV